MIGSRGSFQAGEKYKFFLYAAIYFASINLSQSHLYYSPTRYCIFKRWDMLDEEDKPDVMSGLHNLANYDAVDTNDVIIPWGSGCYYIVKDPKAA